MTTREVVLHVVVGTEMTDADFADVVFQWLKVLDDLQPKANEAFKLVGIEICEEHPSA